MIEQIEKAKENKSEFSEVILKHFALQKERVIRVVDQWKRDTGIDQSDYNKLMSLLASLDPVPGGASSSSSSAASSSSSSASSSTSGFAFGRRLG